MAYTKPKPIFNIGEAMENASKKSYHLDPQMIERLYEENYTVKDTGLPYRQINYLEAQGVIKSTRKDDTQWRRFHLKDLIFFGIIKELRFYSVSDEFLANLHAAFFSIPAARMCDIVIFAAMAGEKIHLTFKKDGQVGFYNITMLELEFRSEKSYIDVNLNEIVSEMWELREGAKLDYINEAQYLHDILRHYDLSHKEAEMLLLIRNRKYKTVTIEKGGKESLHITGKYVDEVKESELTDLVKKGGYGKIELIRKDGKIVHVIQEDAYKL